MKIGLIHQNDKFGFVIVNESNGLAVFNSFKDTFKVPSLEGQHEYAWQAQKEANKFIKEYDYHFKYAREDLTKPIITDISAEEMLQNHYMGIYDGLEDKTHGIEKESQEERDKVYHEIKMVRDELQTVLENIETEKGKRAIKRVLMLYKQLIRKHFRAEDIEDKKREREMPATPPMPGGAPGGMPPLMASIIDTESDNTELVDEGLKKELFEHYGEKICQAIQGRHKGAHFIIKDDSLIICDSDNSRILRIGVNDKLHINNILPIGKTHKIYPYHTADFYQKYWKPIVEEVGHFYVDDNHTLILTSMSSLPDTPNGDGEGVVEGWNTKDKKIVPLEVAFRGDRPTWFFDAAKVEKIASTSKYTEQDYLNAIVKCIDPKLDSIINRTGPVIQIIPHDDFIELDVNFGRGIGVVRLTEKQIEIVPA
jgi:hypothetical protein